MRGCWASWRRDPSKEELVKPAACLIIGAEIDGTPRADRLGTVLAVLEMFGVRRPRVVQLGGGDVAVMVPPGPAAFALEVAEPTDDRSEPNERARDSGPEGQQERGPLHFFRVLRSSPPRSSS
jgi:hypothetical protein